MLSNTLTSAALSSEARPWTGIVWRMVEAQHTASTMKIVDNDDEQDVLEALLEGTLAQVARQTHVGGIQYRSVRDPNPAWYMALLTPQAFSKPKPAPFMQTWWLAVHQEAVTWRRDKESMNFSAAVW